MKLTYFPGCTMYEKAKDFESSALKVLEILKFELQEMEDWYCCGAVSTLVEDNIMTYVAPYRNIVLAQKMENKILTTFCSACYNVLKNTDALLKADPEKKKVLEDFVEEEYNGSVKIQHVLELLKEVEDLPSFVKTDLGNLKVMPYYGCLLLRPFKNVGIDDPESPTIMEDLLSQIGTGLATSPHRIECCGAHMSVNKTGVAEGCVKTIINSAAINGADLIVNSCPLCQYNLDKLQLHLAKKDKDFVTVPVLYFTEIMALAFGIDINEAVSGKHYIDPVTVIKARLAQKAEVPA